MKKLPTNGAHGRARSLRRNSTDAERMLWRAISRDQINGKRFRRQVPFGPYIADFACHAAKLVIELDGGQHDLSSAEEIKRTEFIEAQGYRVLRFWNNEVTDNLDGVLQMILATLGSLSGRGHP